MDSTAVMTLDPTSSGCADRYADLADRRLAVALADEDRAEDAGLDPLDRATCRVHRRWLHRCIASPVHVIMVTGHRWCRTCEASATVAVDELTGTVGVTCSRCHRTPEGRATRQIIRCCMASMAAARDRFGSRS